MYMTDAKRLPQVGHAIDNGELNKNKSAAYSEQSLSDKAQG
jgi:hypothetical protein